MGSSARVSIVAIKHLIMLIEKCPHSNAVVFTGEVDFKDTL